MSGCSSQGDSSTASSSSLPASSASVLRPSAQASPTAAPTHSGSVSAQKVTLRPSGTFSHPLITDGFDGELTATGFVALVAKAPDLPLSLVRVEDEQALPTISLPFSFHALIASSFTAKRFLFAETTTNQKKKVRIWDQGALSTEVEDQIVNGAVGMSQAVALTGKPDERGFLSFANTDRALRFRNRGWQPIALPKPAEKGFSDCFWSIRERPLSDDFLLKQICGAPRREFAYALFWLKSDSDEFERVPFDNALFDPVRASGGAFDVEADGTINLGANNPGKLTLARLPFGSSDWKVLVREMPTRLASSSGAYGNHVVFTDAGPGVVSSDGGQSYRPSGEIPGIITRCNAWGCTISGMSPRSLAFYIW